MELCISVSSACVSSWALVTCCTSRCNSSRRMVVTRSLWYGMGWDLEVYVYLYTYVHTNIRAYDGLSGPGVVWDLEV